jgi:uncharacterized protein (TIGR00369 family)
MVSDAAALVNLVSLMPFAESLGITLSAAERDQVTGSMAWAPERCTTGGILHGGSLMAFADSVGAVCAFLNLPEGAGTSTIESKSNFFRGVSTGSVMATARPVHVGGRTIVVQTELRDDADKLVALVTQTQAVLR